MKPLFVRALEGEAVERFPVWMMRQAGRYLPGYRAVRAKTPFLELCRNPELAAKVSLEPIERFDMDADELMAETIRNSEIARPHTNALVDWFLSDVATAPVDS